VPPAWVDLSWELAQDRRDNVKYIFAIIMQVLEDTDMGFADITPATILAHLKTTYGAINQEDIEANRALLGSDFNPGDPIEDLWLHIKEC
jgi:hypothetical protein